MIIYFIIFKIQILQKFGAIRHTNVMISYFMDAQEITMHYNLIQAGHSLFEIQIKRKYTCTWQMYYIS